MASFQGDMPSGTQSPVEGHEPTASPPPANAAPSAPHYGGKKKRAYAGEAFGFGQGANSALGGQLPAGGAYGAYPAAAPGAAPVAYQQPGYPAADPAGAPAAASYAAPGYQAPINQMTQQFGQMNVGGPAQAAPAPAAAAVARGPMNQLYPADLMAQPFNVAELNYPPPPILLPPNVSVFMRLVPASLFKKYIPNSHVLSRSRVSRPLKQLIALHDTFVLHSTPSQPITPSLRNPSFLSHLSFNHTAPFTMSKTQFPLWLIRSLQGVDAAELTSTPSCHS